MKYFMLAQWIRENQKINLVVEQMQLLDSSLLISFKSGSNLVLHYKTSNPFPWFAEGREAKTFGTNSIWSGLQNSDLTSITIADSDRILYLIFHYTDIYQKEIEQVVVFECMPPSGNIILCRREGGKLIILDALQKYTYADNPRRQVLPGLPYESPQTGFTPTAEDMTYPLEITPAGDSNRVFCTSMNEYFQKYYALVVELKQQTLHKQRLQAHWNKELGKTEKKLALQQNELKEAEQESTWLVYSETIKVNLKQMKKGDTSLQAVNYYDPSLQQIEIPLKPELNPQENLKYYLKKYTKARQGREKISLQIEKTHKDVEQIQSILELFNTEKWKDLDLASGKPSEAIKKLKQTDDLFRLTIDEDWEIVIGRKARENDLISTQIGKPSDWWFHTRIYHGSHVLLRNYHKKEPPVILIELCCGLAAWFSKARNSENVPVDYTQIRYVRKPRKSAPGFVTYSNQKTVFINPVDVTSAKEILKPYAR
jgi:predicted ribosome quality control (RQC) complex YloA/Tae2 family protein